MMVGKNIEKKNKENIGFTVAAQFDGLSVGL